MSDKKTGIKGLIPSTRKGKAVLCAITLFIAFWVLSGFMTAAESIRDDNYYDNPVHELAADFVDDVADKAIAATPNAANSHIDAFRERLTGRSKWANTVIDAEQYWDVDRDYTKLILAMIEVESGGNEDVDWQGNIMEIDPGSGDAWSLLCSGIPEAGIAGNTPQASIYAGVMITRNCIESFQNHLSYTPQGENLNDGALLSQGYNYGYDGWFTYCINNSIATWTLPASQTYQSMMGGIGTAEHGGKVADALRDLLD